MIKSLPYTIRMWDIGHLSSVMKQNIALNAYLMQTCLSSHHTTFPSKKSKSQLKLMCEIEYIDNDQDITEGLNIDIDWGNPQKLHC